MHNRSIFCGFQAMSSFLLLTNTLKKCLSTFGRICLVLPLLAYGFLDSLISYFKICFILGRWLPFTTPSKSKCCPHNIIIAGSGPSLCSSYSDITLWSDSYCIGTIWTILLKNPPNLIVFEAISKNSSIKELLHQYSHQKRCNADLPELALKQGSYLRFYANEISDCINKKRFTVSYLFTISLPLQSKIDWLPGSNAYYYISFFQSFASKIGLHISFQSGTTISSILSYVSTLRNFLNLNPNIITAGVDLYSSEYYFHRIDRSSLIDLAHEASDIDSGHKSIHIPHSTIRYANHRRRVDVLFERWASCTDSKIYKYSRKSLLKLPVWTK